MRFFHGIVDRLDRVVRQVKSKYPRKQFLPHVINLINQDEGDFSQGQLDRDNSITAKRVNGMNMVA